MHRVRFKRCGSMSHTATRLGCVHAFIDESRRRGEYLVAVVEVAAGDLAMVRRRLRSFLLPGQRRLHFVDERTQRRQQLLDEFSRLPIRAQVIAVRVGTPPEAEARRVALTAILSNLDPAVDRLIIESRHGRDHQDRRVIATVLRTLRRPRPLHYDHRLPHEEPGLWLPDGIAWATGAGGAWSKRLEAIPVTISRTEA